MWRYLKFSIEKLLLRGAHFQLLFIAVMIALVSLSAGIVVWIYGGAFPNPADAIWWAFLRLTDPGYLGDDQGALMRVVSTIVTVLGYVLFMGALIAIMTQWLNTKMRTLEAGLTPITMQGHVLLLGWTNRTPVVVRELVYSEGRLRRFLKNIGAKDLSIVILADEVTNALSMAVRDAVGPRWNRRQITFRSGSDLRQEHLNRVAWKDASVIILPGDDYSNTGPSAVDAETIKTLLSLGLQSDQTAGLPMVVAALFDARKSEIARSAYPGKIQIVAGDAVISRLAAQNLRHPGLSLVYGEMLAHHQGQSIFIREIPEIAGEPFSALRCAWPRATLLGVLRWQDGVLRPVLNPPAETTIGDEDRCVFLAPNFAATELAPGFERSGEVVRNTGRPATEKRPPERILILGWNQKLPALIKEFDSYTGEHFTIDNFSLTATETRQRLVQEYCVKLETATVHFMDGDYTSPADLTALKPETYDRILFVSSDRLDSGEEADARTILGHLLLESHFRRTGAEPPETLLELAEPENETLFDAKPTEIIISPRIVSHLLAHIALRPDLSVVFDELFTAEGAEIFFRSPTAYGLGRGPLPFGQISDAVAAFGDIALGIFSDRAELTLNPMRDSEWELGQDTEIVVLTTYTPVAEKISAATSG